MQVDTDQLRTAAGRLRHDVVHQLRKAADPVDKAGEAWDLAGNFDLYTTSAPYLEAADAWRAEIGVLLRAAEQLADSLERAAQDYDAADQAAAGRLAPR
jgi:hypothetical protein